MTPDARQIVFENVSKFYGEVLGVNKVSFPLHPGITSLVGPNGSGKTTLMNLLTGLIRPSQGAIYVLGLTPQQPIEFFRQVGYCTQFDSFPPGTNGYDFMVLATARRQSLRTKPWNAPAWRKWHGAKWRVIAKV